MSQLSQLSQLYKSLEAIQKQAKDDKKQGKIMLIITSISALIGASTAYLAMISIKSNESTNEQNIKNSPQRRIRQQKALQQNKSDMLKKLCSEQQFKLEGLKDETQIKEQLNDIFQEHTKRIKELREKKNISNETTLAQETLRAEIITGISGSGKTTAIRQLLKKYRAEGKKEIYYISFKVNDSIPCEQEVIQKFKTFRELPQSTIVILDDINHLSLIKGDKLFQRQIYDFIDATYVWKIKVFCISSSSQFSLDAKKYKKTFFWQRVLQPLESDRLLWAPNQDGVAGVRQILKGKSAICKSTDDGKSREDPMIEGQIQKVVFYYFLMITMLRSMEMQQLMSCQSIITHMLTIAPQVDII